MKTKLHLLTVALIYTFSNAGLAMTKAEYTTQKDIVSGAYKVNKDKCSTLKANAKDICISEAKGTQKIAKAELEEKYNPTARHTEIVSLAKGSAAYATAKEKCDDASGNAKTICRSDAKAAYVATQEEARVIRVKAETGKLNTSMRNIATQEEINANYKAATARCDSLAGVSKDTCISDAKTKFNMK